MYFSFLTKIAEQLKCYLNFIHVSCKLSSTLQFQIDLIKHFISGVFQDSKLLVSTFKINKKTL
jgi:hypothetical protein